MTVARRGWWLTAISVPSASFPYATTNVSDENNIFLILVTDMQTFFKLSEILDFTSRMFVAEFWDNFAGGNNVSRV